MSGSAEVGIETLAIVAQRRRDYAWACDCRASAVDPLNEGRDRQGGRELVSDRNRDLMRITELDVLIVPGWTNSGPGHWQSRWLAKLSTARRVDMGSWDQPVRAEWTNALAKAVQAASRPALLVAHSLGVVAVAHAAPLFAPGKVAGGFLVGLPDLEQDQRPPEIDPAFVPIPRIALPFPSVLVHSSSDPYCKVSRALEFAAHWGSETADAGDAGHINAASGHGPWPEGLMRLAGFLQSL